MKPVILIPTYNESISIVELLRSLEELHIDPKGAQISPACSYSSYARH